MSGYPFRAVVDFQDFSYTWCKVEPIPGEKLVPEPGKIRPPSRRSASCPKGHKGDSPL